MCFYWLAKTDDVQIATIFSTWNMESPRRIPCPGCESRAGWWSCIGTGMCPWAQKAKMSCVPQDLILRLQENWIWLKRYSLQAKIQQLCYILNHFK